MTAHRLAELAGTMPNRYAAVAGKMTDHAAAAHLGVTRRQVFDYRERHAIPAYGRHAETDTRRDDVRRLLSVDPDTQPAHVARVLGCTKRTAGRLLREARTGVIDRAPRRRELQAWLDEQEAAVSTRDVAEWSGTTTKAALQALRLAGAELVDVVDRVAWWVAPARWP